MISIPHFAAPFSFVAGHASVLEQDDPAEIGAAVYNVAVCPQGFRIDLPDFGRPDPSFQAMPLDTAPILAALRRWEPRADLSAEEVDDLLAGVASVKVEVAPADRRVP